MNVSINLLAAPPSKWYAPKTVRNPDPLKRWHTQELQEPESQVEPRYVVPHVQSSLTLKDAHYAAMEAQKAKMDSLSCHAKVPRQLAAISGYGGFIPMKESHNILGVSFKKANELAASVHRH